MIKLLIKLYFSTVKILTQRPTHISAVATVLLITKTFTVKYYDRRIYTNTTSIINNNTYQTRQRPQRKMIKKRKKKTRKNRERERERERRERERDERERERERERDVPK